MKIRTGFVSNSSSSSFCIVGIIVDSNEFKSTLLDSVIKEFEENSDNEGEDINEHIYEVADSHGLEYFGGDEVGDVMGIDIEEIGDDETMGAFKERVSVELRKVFKEIKGVGIISDSYYC